MARITNPEVASVEVVMSKKSKKRLEELAARRNTSMSKLIRAALEAYTADELKEPIEFDVDPRRQSA